MARSARGPLWGAYENILHRYGRLPLPEERRLIARSQEGSVESAQEMVLRHVGFVIFRLRKKVSPGLLKRFGEDMLSDGIVILHQKIKTYDLNYRDKQGHEKQVRFVSYIWKRIDGFIIDFLQERFQRPWAA